jgi:hypothetical protein
MSAAAIIKAAYASGIELSLTPTGSIKFKGHSDAVAKWKPVLVDNKAAIIDELSRQDPTTWEERAAHLEFDTGLPREWAEPFAKMLCGNPPDGYTADRWQQIVDNGLIFADQWGAGNALLSDVAAVELTIQGMSFCRATSANKRPSTAACETTCCFSSTDQRRRRSTPLKISCRIESLVEDVRNDVLNDAC